MVSLSLSEKESVYLAPSTQFLKENTFYAKGKLTKAYFR